MRKIQYIFICLSILFFSSCIKEEMDVFSASPAERLNEALKADFELLTSAENGWVMEYFATPVSPGYSILVKFNRSGSAVLASKSELTKNKEFEMDSCLFEMIGDNGPVLTFNTYSSVLHRFSNPENPDGYGLEGDYEFVVMKTSGEQIILRGKKTSTIVILNKLPLTVSWTEYIGGLDEMKNLLFANNVSNLTMTIGKSVYTFSNGNSSVFSIVKEGPVVNRIDAPFIITRTGLRLYTVLGLEGLSFQNFTLNAEKSALVSVEQPGLKIAGPEDLALFFVSYVRTWEFVPEQLSQDVKTYYDSIVQSCTEKYNAQDVKLALKYYKTRNSFVLSLAFHIGEIPNEGNMDLTINTKGKDKLIILNKGTGDVQGNVYYSEVAGYKGLAELLAADYALSTTVKINPQVLKFTNVTQPNTWFSLIGK
jgi:hypothetical protein